MARAKVMSLQEQAAAVLEKAEAKGVSTNYFFRTTFERYETQLAVLEQLEEAINEFGPVVKKEYVKGRENVCTNPAITEYNRTSTAANGTVATLINIVKSMPAEEAERSKLQDLIDHVANE